MCFWTGHVALLTLQSLLKRILSLSNWHGCWDQDMEDLQRKVASRRGHSAFDQTPKQNGRYNGRWDRCGTKSNNWYYIGQLEQNCQKLSQLDSKIADLIVKLEDLELEILQSEELQCAIKGQICRVKTFLEISQTQQLVEPTEQNIQPPSGIITIQSPQSAELESNCPWQGAALDTSMVSVI